MRVFNIKSDVYMQTDRLCKGDLNNPLYKSLSLSEGCQLNANE